MSTMYPTRLLCRAAALCTPFTVRTRRIAYLDIDVSGRLRARQRMDEHHLVYVSTTRLRHVSYLLSRDSSHFFGADET